MTQTMFTDEQLMAYADGEADAQTCLDIEAALRTDPTLAQRIALFSTTRNIAQQAMPLQKVPSELEARIRAMATAKAKSEVKAEPEKTAEPARPTRLRPVAANSNRRFWDVPIAASIALAIGLSSSYFMTGGQSSAPASLNVAGLVDEAFVNALSTVPSGKEQLVGENNFKAIASFNDKGGNLCREFEKDFKSGASIVGIACREENKEWDVRAVFAANKAEDGYAPASSLDAIDAYLQSTEAGPVLSAEEEEAALKAAP
ncbi:MAG: anti-sigma factor family protein [Rhizobiaceae bacterium]